MKKTMFNIITYIVFASGAAFLTMYTKDPFKTILILIPIIFIISFIFKNIKNEI